MSKAHDLNNSKVGVYTLLCGRVKPPLYLMFEETIHKQPSSNPAPLNLH